MEDLVRWSAAADDYTTFHYDPAAAEARGFDGPVVHGTWQASLIGRMLTDWLGPDARVRELACRYRRPAIVGTPLSCHGEVTGIAESGEETLATFEVSVESPPGTVTTTGTATVAVPNEAASAQGDVHLATPQFLAALGIGEITARYTFRVTAERIRRFSAVLADREPTEILTADDEPDDPVEAPTTFYAALDPLELRLVSHDRGIDLIPYRKTGGGNAFNEIEYERPIRAGDVVTAEVVFTDVYERQGRTGPLLFRVRETRLSDEDGERIGVSRSAHVYAFDVPGYRPPDTARSAAGHSPSEDAEPLPVLTRIPTTGTLVRYAAAADDYAPLHFDHEYALSRGYDGVIVHGFLKAGYLATLVEDWAGPDAFVRRFRAEYRGPDYPDDPIHCSGRVVRRFELGGHPAAELELWTARDDGSVTTRGSATVQFPG